MIHVTNQAWISDWVGSLGPHPSNCRYGPRNCHPDSILVPGRVISHDRHGSSDYVQTLMAGPLPQETPRIIITPPAHPSRLFTAQIGRDSFGSAWRDITSRRPAGSFAGG